SPAAELFDDGLTQIVHVELRCIDDDVGQRANWRQFAALGLNAPLYRAVRAQWMRAARLAETAHQRGVVRLEKQKLGRNAAPDPPIHGGEALRGFPFADVYSHGCAAHRR